MSVARTWNVFGDCLTESNWRMMMRGIYDTLSTSSLWTRTADTNQINWDDPMVTACQYNGFPPVLSNSVSNVPERVIDGNTSNSWASGINPTGTTPLYLIFDAGKSTVGGTNVTNACLSYRIYFSNTTGDPNSWTLVGTNAIDFSNFAATSWTTIDTQTGQTAGGVAGYKTYTGFTNASSYRFYALRFTASNGANIVIAEWNAYTAAALGGTQIISAITHRPTGSTSVTASNGFTNYEIWGMTDTLQATAPLYLRILYGSGSTFGWPIMYVQIGTATDGNGNITGVNAGSQVLAYVPGTLQTALYRCYGSADTNRFAMSLITNGGTMDWQLGVERLPDPTTGADTGDGMALEYFTTSARNYYAIPNPATFGGAMPTAETDSPGIMSTVQTIGSFGNYANFEDIGLRLGPRKYGPSRNWCNYYKDQYAEQVFTPTFLGGTKTFLALGNSIQPYARGGYSGGAPAIRYE